VPLCPDRLLRADMVPASSSWVMGSRASGISIRSPPPEVWAEGAAGGAAVAGGGTSGIVRVSEQRGQVPNCTMQWLQTEAPQVCRYWARPAQPEHRAPGAAGDRSLTVAGREAATGTFGAGPMAAPGVVEEVALGAAGAPGAEPAEGAE
jgi:hypothetical protein